MQAYKVVDPQGYEHSMPVLEERGKTHGRFIANALLSQAIKREMRTARADAKTELSADMLEALDMIALKMSRICTGNPREPDHWKDIAGYATLISDKLENTK